MNGVAEEMAGVNFGDVRLNRRGQVILDRLMAQPSVSIPAACRGWAETLAAYRFFDNANVTAERVLAPHQRATLARMAEQSVVLCVQDTTELDYTGHNHVQGLGPLTHDTQQGLYLHPTLAVTPERVCLGVLDALMWARREDTYGKRTDRANKPIEEKESWRWVQGYQRVCALREQMPQTQLVYIADRESDVYELFTAAPDFAPPADWLIRATQDRVLAEEPGSKFSTALAHAPVLGEVQFDVPATDKRRAREVRQHLKAVRVAVRPPRRAGHTLEPVEVTVLLAQEIDPPANEEPITWVLLTNLHVTTAEQALEKMRWYLCRWQIEVYFRILKSGCRIEELQLETLDRLRPALALYMIVAWRVLFLTILGRACPELPCDRVFETEEWQAIYIVAQRRRPPPTPPALNDIVRMIAGFGGFLGRKQDGEPGPKVMWIGLQRTRDFVLALAAGRNREDT